MTSHELQYLVTVKITVNDEDVITRVLENHDDQHVPQPRKHRGTGWQDVYYGGMHDDKDVLDHLAFNCIANGCRGVSHLDGWVDMSDDAVSMDIQDVEPW